MKLYYWKKASNFGDQLNAVLWPALLGDLLDDSHDALFVGIGTLLNSELPPDVPKIIFGTGAGYGPPPRIDENCEVLCVRGPQTAAALRLPPDSVVTDSALLARKLNWQRTKISAPVIMIPHWQSTAFVDWSEVCAEVGIHFADPRESPETVIGAIRSASLVITESLHGAILADAFRIPWIPVAIYEQIDRGKWADWMQTHNMVYEPREIPGPYKSYFSVKSNCAHYQQLSTSRLAFARKAFFRLEAAAWRSQQKKIHTQMLLQLRDLLRSPKPVLSAISRSDALFHELERRLEKFINRRAAAKMQMAAN